MKETRARIREIFTSLDGTGARIECEPPLRPAPGQYLLAQVENVTQVLPVPLFAQAVENSFLVVPPPLPPEWFPGLELTLRGPLGNGFHPPSNTRHLLLADLSPNHGQRLLSLLQAFTRPIEIVLLTDSAADHLPVEIEILPLHSLNETLAWADFAALELSLKQVKLLPKLAGKRSISEFPPYCEALIDTPMICGGVAGCGVCSVRVNHSWALACKDGPVFRLNQLSEDE